MTDRMFNRRQILAGLGLTAAAVGGAPLLSACGGSSGLSGDDGGGGGGASGAKPTIHQWYHQYGEAGHAAGGQALRRGVPRRDGQGPVDPGRLHVQAQQRAVVELGPRRVRVRAANIARSRAVRSSPSTTSWPTSRTTTPTPTSSPPRSTARCTRSRSSTTWACSTTARACWRRPAVKPPTTLDELIKAAKALTTGDQKGLFIGNDAGVTPSFGGGSLLGRSCGPWAATT